MRKRKQWNKQSTKWNLSGFENKKKANKKKEKKKRKEEVVG